MADVAGRQACLASSRRGEAAGRQRAESGWGCLARPQMELDKPGSQLERERSSHHLCLTVSISITVTDWVGYSRFPRALENLDNQ